jgi:hypothetical protein
VCKPANQDNKADDVGKDLKKQIDCNHLVREPEIARNFELLR